MQLVCVYPILGTRISELCPFAAITVRPPPPPGFWNRVDWRALVKDWSPQLANVREQHFLHRFFSSSFNISWKMWFSSDFWDFFFRIWLDWRAWVKVRIPIIEAQRRFFCWKSVFFKNFRLKKNKMGFLIFWDFLKFFKFFGLSRLFFIIVLRFFYYFRFLLI